MTYHTQVSIWAKWSMAAALCVAALACTVAFPSLLNIVAASQGLAAFAIPGLAVIGVGLLRPSWLVGLFPLLIPVFYVGGTVPTFIVFSTVGAAFLGGLLTARSDQRIWSVLPIIAVAYFVWRELGDISGDLSLYSPVTMTLLGLAVVATATLAPPDPRWLLVCTGAVGVLYSVVANVTASLTLERTATLLGTNANGLGALSAAGVVAGLALLTSSEPSAWRVAGALLAAANVVGLFIAGSQGGYAALAGGALMLVVLRRQVIPAIAIGTVLTLVALSWVAGFGEQLGGTTRTDFGLEQSRAARVSLAQQAWGLFASHPWLGVDRVQAVVVYPYSPVAVQPHNVYLQIALIGGVLGICVGLAVVGLILLRRGSVTDRKLLLPLLVTFLVSGLSLQWHIYPLVLIPAVVLGTYCAQPKHEGRRKEAACVERPRVGSANGTMPEFQHQ